MFEDLKSNGTASPWVRDVVLLALWAPIVIVLLGLALGVVGIGFQLATGRIDPAALAGVADAVNPTLVVLGVAGGIGYLYLMVANETFGEETVEAATEQVQDMTDDVSDATDE